MKRGSETSFFKRAAWGYCGSLIISGMVEAPKQKKRERKTWRLRKLRRAEKNLREGQ